MPSIAFPMPHRGVSDVLTEDGPPTVAGAAAALAIYRLTAFPFHLSRGTERRDDESMMHAFAQARTGWPTLGMTDAVDNAGSLPMSSSGLVRITGNASGT